MGKIGFYSSHKKEDIMEKVNKIMCKTFLVKRQYLRISTSIEKGNKK